MILKLQTNLYSLKDVKVIRCYSEFNIEGSTDELLLYAHALDISEVYLIQDNIKVDLKFEHNKKTKISYKNENTFNTSIYTSFKKSCPNLKILIPASINITSHYKLRIIYAPTNDNSFINYIPIVNNSFEFFCFAFFPYFSCTSHDIESIFVYPDNKTLLAPGTLIRKNKRNNLQYCTYLTQHITHLPFVLGSFKCVDCSQNLIRAKVYIPVEFKIDDEFTQDICIILQYLQENYLKTNFNISIVFSRNNIQTVSQNTIFLPVSLLPLNGIDQNIFIRLKICELFSKMLFCNLRCTDFWLSVAVREYMKNAFIREMLGENELHYSIKMDLEFVCENDICESSLINEIDKNIRDENYIFYCVKFNKTDHFKMVKGRLFIHILENHLSKAFLERIMHNTWHKNETDTMDFIKTIKDVSGKDMTQLFNYYIFKPGIIHCFITYEVDKKGKADVYLKQVATSKKVNANKRLLSNLKIKVYEQEGVFEHKFTVDNISFQCHYRTKKRKPDVKPVQINESIIETTENESKQQTQEKTEVTENTGQILYVRGDPGIEQMTKITIEQPDYMFTEQLITEKNVYSQIDAIIALRKKASDESIQILERILNDNHIFYKIRLMILMSLSQTKIENKKNLNDLYKGNDISDEKSYSLGFQRLIQFFVKKNCVPGSTIPKSNDFTAFPSYLVQKYLSGCLSLSDPEISKKFNDRDLISKNIIIAFLLNIIKYNSYDDSGLYCSSSNRFYNQNYIANSNYIASIIESLSYQICSRTKVDLSPIINELERKRIGDIAFPSYQNLVTSSVLKSCGRMCFYGIVALNYNLVLELSKPGHFYSVREEAIYILMTCFPKKSFDYLIELFWEEERHFKIFILYTIKSIVEVTQGSSFEDEEYTEAIKELNIVNMDMNIKYTIYEKFKILYENKSIFDQILDRYHYDSIIFEVVTDIIYLLFDNEMKYVIEEKIIQLEKPSYIIQLIINNVVTLSLPEKAKKEISDLKKKKQEAGMQLLKEEIKNPFIINFHRFDIVELCYDDFINKYFLNIIDFIKKNNGLISKQNNGQEVICDDLGNSKNLNIEIKSNSLNQIGGNNGYVERSSLYFEKLCDMLGYKECPRMYNNFLISLTSKYLKRHKYFSRLGIKLTQDQSFSCFKHNLHKQFCLYYSTQKYGSQYYLNSKALENYLEQIIYEVTLFEPLIEINDSLHKFCCEFIDEVMNLDDIDNFLDPVDYIGLNIPNYVDIIRIPLDLTTIKRRLISRKYFALEYFILNIEIMFINSMHFNEINSKIYDVAKSLLVSTRQLILSKLISHLIPDYNLFRTDMPLDFTEHSLLDCKLLYNKLSAKKNPDLAVEQVYKILLDVRSQKEATQFTSNIIDHRRIIKKHIALNDMISKAKNGSYLSVGHVFADMNLLIKNVVLLNGNTSWVVRVCRKMENYFKKEMFVAFGMRYLSVKKEVN